MVDVYVDLSTYRVENEIHLFSPTSGRTTDSRMYQSSTNEKVEDWYIKRNGRRDD